MKIIFLLILIPTLVFSKVHYAKVEPYESVVIKSAISGLVTAVDLTAEGTTVHSRRVVYIDDTLDKVNLKGSQKSILLLQEMLSINKNISKSLNGSMQRQEGYYRRISKLSTASKNQKDNAYTAFTTAKTQYLNTQEKMVSLEKQILDLEYKTAQLEDSILKKSLIIKDKYLYQLLVRVGDFVAPGSALARVDDTSRAKLVLFLESKELENIGEKVVHIDGVETNYKVDKVWRVADEKFISSYRAEIIIPAPKGAFSKLVKVEIK